MTENYIDHHCHLSDERIFDQALDLIRAASAVGVGTLILAGVDPADWLRQKEIRKTLASDLGLVASLKLLLNFGLHPWWIEKYSLTEIVGILTFLERELPHADGLSETGLDHGKKRDPARFQDQEFAFREQIRLALKWNKPLTLHVVSAHEKAIQILREEHASNVPIVLHSYSGNSNQLAEYQKLGAYFSFSGSICKVDAHERTKQALRAAPLDRLFFETDSPDQPWGEGINVPANIVQVYEAGAKLLELPLDTVIKKVAENLGKVYYSSLPI